jgi:nitrogen fixation NifU-like protein
VSGGGLDLNLDSIYTEIITEQSNSKRNRRHLENPTFALEGKNPSCGDEIKLEVKLKDDIVEDASFTGVGCAISQASTSIMIDLIRGKNIKEVEKLAELFISMIQKKIVGDEKLAPLGEANALKNISNMPARVKCATMPWHTVESIINLNKDDTK